MRWHGRLVTVYAYAEPVDMRKRLRRAQCTGDGRAAARSPERRRLHLRQRDRVRAKVLQWDGTGLCVYAKRLDRGRFARLWRDDGDAPITLTVSELELFLDGSTIVGRVTLSPPAVTQFLLASDRR